MTSSDVIQRSCPVTFHPWRRLTHCHLPQQSTCSLIKQHITSRGRTVSIRSREVVCQLCCCAAQWTHTDRWVDADLTELSDLGDYSSFPASTCRKTASTSPYKLTGHRVSTAETHSLAFCFSSKSRILPSRRFVRVCCHAQMNDGDRCVHWHVTETVHCWGRGRWAWLLLLFSTGDGCLKAKSWTHSCLWLSCCSMCRRAVWQLWEEHLSTLSPTAMYICVNQPSFVSLRSIIFITCLSTLDNKCLPTVSGSDPLHSTAATNLWSELVPVPPEAVTFTSDPLVFIVLPQNEFIHWPLTTGESNSSFSFVSELCSKAAFIHYFIFPWSFSEVRLSERSGFIFNDKQQLLNTGFVLFPACAPVCFLCVSAGLFAHSNWIPSSARLIWDALEFVLSDFISSEDPWLLTLGVNPNYTGGGSSDIFWHVFRCWTVIGVCLLDGRIIVALAGGEKQDQIVVFCFLLIKPHFDNNDQIKRFNHGQCR